VRFAFRKLEATFNVYNGTDKLICNKIYIYEKKKGLDTFYYEFVVEKNLWH